MMYRHLCLISSTIASMLLASCTPQPSFPHFEGLTPITVPSDAGGQPNLFAHHDQLYLSWVEYLNDTTDVLMWTQLESENQWAQPREVTRGHNWFVNWADFPSLAVFADGHTMAAHWLQMHGEGTYEYDVHIAISHDGGHSWPIEFVPHRDSIAAEHGFVTLLPRPDNQMQAFWLDGRQTPDGGPMTVRTAVFDSLGRLSEEALVDSRTCDCCQTDAVWTSSGPLAAWRDRSPEEIRDIFTSYNTAQGWAEPLAVHHDGWLIAGCPVNGPALAAHGQQVVIVWFTMADNEARVQAAFSSDGGRQWSEPMRLDTGQALGRVDVVWLPDRQGAMATWLQQVPNAQDEAPGGKIMARFFDSSGHMSELFALAESDPSRQSGFPILARVDKRIYLAWTAVTDQGTQVRTAKVKLR